MKNKAAHEFDEPKSCSKCMFYIDMHGSGDNWCHITRKDLVHTYLSSRSPDCPLKIVPKGSRCIMCESDRCESQFRVGDDCKYLCMDCLREIGESAKRCLEPESEQLKPCPFCGGSADPYGEKDGNKGIWGIQCLKCGVKVPNTYPFGPLDKAIAAWNRREG